VRARPASGVAHGGAESAPPAYWVWVGWSSTSGADKILTVSGYEQRS
jgi:hypothetical protein